MDLRGTTSVTFEAYGGTFPVAITIDTTDRYSPYLELEHDSRASNSPGQQRYRVGLVTTPQPLGGVRWWFVCPRTGRRAVRLLLPLGGNQFRSRQAYGLGYGSQREDAKGRAQLQAEKIYRQLRGEGHWMDGAPDKPKWMRWRTYERKAARLDHYCARFDGAWTRGGVSSSCAPCVIGYPRAKARRTLCNLGLRLPSNIRDVFATALDSAFPSWVCKRSIYFAAGQARFDLAWP